MELCPHPRISNEAEVDPESVETHIRQLAPKSTQDFERVLTGYSAAECPNAHVGSDGPRALQLADTLDVLRDQVALNHREPADTTNPEALCCVFDCFGDPVSVRLEGAPAGHFPLAREVHARDDVGTKPLREAGEISRREGIVAMLGEESEPSRVQKEGVVGRRVRRADELAADILSTKREDIERSIAVDHAESEASAMSRSHDARMHPPKAPAGGKGGRPSPETAPH